MKRTCCPAPAAPAVALPAALPFRWIVGLALIGVAVACNAARAPEAPPPVMPPTPSTPPPLALPSATVAVAPPAPPPPPPPTVPASPVLQAPPGKLSVLLISIDSLRADMPWTGYPRNIAPNLTNFAKSAVTYTHAYSISSYTAMSVAGLLAGRYPGELDRSGYFFSSYPKTVLMLQDVLHRASVRTLSAQAHFYFDKDHAGFHHGFDVYEIVKGISADNKTDKNITSPQHLELAQKILADRANTAEPFFAWFHFMDPHDEYMPHPGVGPYGKSSRDKYDAEVTFTDDYVGKLIEFARAQPYAKNLAIMITSDHGEAFGERKMHRHGFEVYETLVRVPLLVQAPGITPRQIDVPRSAIDLAPTVLDLTGTPAEPTFEGKSLVPELYGKPPEERDVIVDLPRTSDNDRRRALIHGNYKIIAYGDDFVFDLYDLASDPLEAKDLKREDKETFEAMKARYKAAVKQLKDICPRHTEKLKGKNERHRC